MNEEELQIVLGISWVLILLFCCEQVIYQSWNLDLNLYIFMNYEQIF